MFRAMSRIQRRKEKKVEALNKELQIEKKNKIDIREDYGKRPVLLVAYRSERKMLFAFFDAWATRVYEKQFRNQPVGVGFLIDCSDDSSVEESSD